MPHRHRTSSVPTPRPRLARPPAPRTLAPLVVLVLLGCSEAGTSGEVDADALRRLPATEIQRIGSIEDPDLGFASITAVDVDEDEDGRIYVGEAQDVAIRVYTPDGLLLRRIGREGEGPGEFSRVPRFGVVGDTVWAFESFNRRLTLFDREGALRSTARVEEVAVPLHGTRTGIVLPRLMRPDGRFLGYLTLFTSRPRSESSVAEGDTVSVPWVLFDGEGAVTDTLGFDPYPPPDPSSRDEIEVGSLEFVVPDPPDDDLLTAVLPDGRILVDRTVPATEDDASFSVTRVTFVGDTVYHRMFGYRPRGFPEVVLDTLATRSALRPGGLLRIVGGVPEPIGRPADTVAVVAALRRAMDFPAFQTPIQADFLGSDGSVWLRREDRGEPTYDWLVLDPAGESAGVVELPRGLRPMWARGGELLAVETDELGVPWLVRYRIGEA